MVMLGVFLFNLLCGFVPCDPNFGRPVISKVPYVEVGSRGGGRPENKSQIEAKVETHLGSFQGFHMKTVGGRTIYAFEGILYGRAERWKPPKPVTESWFGKTYQATKRGSDCLQLSAAKFIRVYGEEQCLYLNVFTPDLPYKGDSPMYPVLIYFHSGSFMMGSGSEHGPAYLLEENVILVTVNYRLGALGFMSLGNRILRGNFGLRDQSLAIQWVSENIASFGGNVSNINLMGYSAGGISSHLHMMSNDNKTRSIFNKVISLGAGSAFQHWAVQSGKRARYYTTRLAKRFRCPTKDDNALMKCMQKVPSNRLVAEQLNLFDWFPFPAVLFAPVVEPEGDDAFLTHTPEEAYHSGKVDAKPWIHGTTSHEGLTAILVLELFFRWLAFRLNWNLAAKSFLDLNYLSLEDPNLNVSSIVHKITNYYLKDKPPIVGNQFEFAEIFTHRFFHFGSVKGLLAHSEIAPTYAYYFSFRKGKYSMGNLYGHRSWEWAPGHAEDEYYWFNTTTQHPGFAETDPDYKMSRIMSNFIVNFITTGVPSYTTKDGNTLRVWDPVFVPHPHGNISMLQWDEEIKMISYPDLDKLKFWESLQLKDMTPWQTPYSSKQ